MLPLMCTPSLCECRSEGSAWSGYEQIGSNREAREEDSGGEHGHGRYDLDDPATEREGEDADFIPLRSHVALSGSHDCV